MSLKKIIQNLQKQHLKLEELVESRETYFYDRSDTWQESEKGEEYEYRTQEIETAKDDLDSLIDDLLNLE